MEMKKKKALVIGCGSIGTRYIKILNELNYSVECFDINKNNYKKLKDDIYCHETLEQSIKINPEIAIIATPPNSHYSCLKSIINSKAKILLEKPLAANKKDTTNILKIAKRNKNRIWCVANMRYHPGFKILKQNLKILKKVYYVNSYFSHNLSQMRPKQKKIYAENRNQGGVIFDCVHDLDLVSNLFGKLKIVNSLKASIGKKKIEAEDYAVLNLKTKSKINILIQLDFLSRWKNRGIKIVGDRGTLVWDSQGKNPEIISVKLFDKKGLVKNYLNNKTLSNDYVYKKMLIDFTDKRKNLQTVDKAYEIFNLAFQARLSG